MSNGEEVWQVAGRRRHRRPGGSEVDQHQPELRRTNRNSSDVHGRRKSKSETHRGGYSYNASTKHPPLEQAEDGHREELMRNELAKLEELKALLRETALWERLVEGLRSVLAQLGLADPCGNEGTAADVSPAAAASTDSMPACSGSTAGGPGRDADSPAGRRRRVLKELVCYGIGNFSESDSSRYQLALALCLRDLLSTASSAVDVAAAGTSTAASRVMPGGGSAAAAAAAAAAALGPAILVFDPVMGETEKAMLATLGCSVLQNEEGKRSCCCRRRREEPGNGGGGGSSEGDEEGEFFLTTTPTLFFMPHCPQRLYSNVLWANWSSCALGSIVILGNKLSSYGDRLLAARARADPTNALLRAGPLLQDVDLCLPYPAPDRPRWRRDVDKLPGLERAFNDLALSFSGPEARGSAGGGEALRGRPLEFVEAEDGELVTGRAGARGVDKRR